VLEWYGIWFVVPHYEADTSLY